VTLNRKIQLVAAILLGACVGAAMAGRLSFGETQSDKAERATVFTDTSGVCVSDYCGCFEDLSRSRLLTNSANRSATH
jgi:hypothetical protein